MKVMEAGHLIHTKPISTFLGIKIAVNTPCALGTCGLCLLPLAASRLLRFPTRIPSFSCLSATHATCINRTNGTVARPTDRLTQRDRTRGKTTFALPPMTVWQDQESLSRIVDVLRWTFILIGQKANIWNTRKAPYDPKQWYPCGEGNNLKLSSFVVSLVVFTAYFAGFPAFPLIIKALTQFRGKIRLKRNHIYS